MDWNNVASEEENKDRLVIIVTHLTPASQQPTAP